MAFGTDSNSKTSHPMSRGGCVEFAGKGRGYLLEKLEWNPQIFEKCWNESLRKPADQTLEEIRRQPVIPPVSSGD